MWLWDNNVGQQCGTTMGYRRWLSVASLPDESCACQRSTLRPRKGNAGAQRHAFTEFPCTIEYAASQNDGALYGAHGRRHEPTRNVRDRLVTLLSVSSPLS